VLSIFFAYLIDPLVRVIQKPFELSKLGAFMPRPAAIVSAYVVVFAIVGVGIASVAPRVVEQAKELGNNLPAYGTAIRQRSADLTRRFDRLRIPDEVQAKINDRITTVGEELTSTVGNFLINLVTYLPWLILIPILAFFFLKDVHLFRISILRMFPAGRWRMRAEAVVSDINSTLAAYTRAMLISCFLIATICTIGFYFVGIKYALLFGILAGIFEFVPLLGPLTIAIIVTLAAAFSDDPWKALYVAIFLVVLRLVQDYFLYPRIVRGGIHLHPLAIILSVLAGEQVAGIPGVFISIPIVAIVTVLYKHILLHTGNTGFFSGWLQPEEVTIEEKL
jgi:predicted PurR-regulated permease PerM